MLREGDMFGNYRVVKRLGKGGMGEVWLLKGADADAWFAVKILDSESSKDHESRKRFVREATIAMEIKHQNLVQVFDVGEDPDTGLDYILMEYIPGGTLKDVIRESGALPVRDALKITAAIASVLEVIGQRGIVHRDIKPENIMFAADGTPKLADLGIAFAHRGESTLTLTVTGSFVGTPAYTSPEQMIDPHYVDIRSDIYSLGIVLFEMLAGKRPYRDESYVQAMARALKGKAIIDIRNFRPDAGTQVSELVRRMCASDRKERISAPYLVVNICNAILAQKPLVPGKSRKPAIGGRAAMGSRLPTAAGGKRRRAYSPVGDEEYEESSGRGMILFIVLALIALGIAIFVLAAR